MKVWLEVISITQQHPFKLRSIPKEIHAVCAPQFSTETSSQIHTELDG